MKAKIKRILISPTVLFKVMQEGTAWRVKKGVPIDAELRGFTLDPLTQNLHLFIEHESFDSVEIEKEVSPVLQTTFEKIS